MPTPRALRRLLLPLALLLTTMLAPPARAQETSEPCVPGTDAPICTFWTGVVTHIADGDTLDVTTSAGAARVRMTGIQAMEQSVYSRNRHKRRGQCHALEATARLEDLVRAGGDIVRLSAQDPASHSGTRLRRSVSVRIDGAWHDVGQMLVDEGLALWMPNSAEWAWNTEYSVRARQAAERRAGLWDTEYCGGGPPAALKLWVNSDADGNDGAHPEGEWVRVKNLDATTPVALGGWWLRDSGLRRFTFPAETVVPAGGGVTVHVGSAPPGDLGWGLGMPVFENRSDDGRGMGDGAYLFDPEGDLRAWMMYPCRWNCTDPAMGMLSIRVQASGRESVTVRNVGSASVDLEGYRLVSGARSYAFGPGVLQPGEALRVRVLGSPSNDTRLDRSWGADRALLRDSAGFMQLETFDDIQLDCDAWGQGRCP